MRSQAGEGVEGGWWGHLILQHSQADQIQKCSVLTVNVKKTAKNVPVDIMD